MSSIFPDVASGGVVVRTQAGVCQNPSNVQQAYCPPATFNTTCDLLYLPSDCTARFTAAQINAFQSELLGLAVCFDPNGTWNCNSLTNLCTAFNSWVSGTADTDLPALIEQALCSAPGGTPAQDAALLFCDNAGSLLSAPLSDVLGAFAIATAICANAAARQAIAGCTLSGDADNRIVLGSDGLHYVGPGAAAAEICSSPAARAQLAACLVSTDPEQGLVIAPGDSLLYRRRTHRLSGRQSVTDTTQTAVTGVATTLRSSTAFNIPNSSLQNIEVLITMSMHAIIQNAAGESSRGSYFIRSGPTLADPGLLTIHAGGAHEFPPAPEQSHQDHWTTESRTLTIPPGGLNLFLIFGTDSGGGTLPGGGDVLQPSCDVTWYGVSHDSVN